jgi:hypothetical protein
VLQSSAASAVDGFNTGIDTDPLEWIKDNNPSSFLSLGPDSKGVFNLPHCGIGSDEMTLGDFFDLLDTPETVMNSGSRYGAVSHIFHCFTLLSFPLPLPFLSCHLILGILRD